MQDALNGNPPFLLRRLILAGLVFAFTALPASTEFQISSLSTRPDMVTGGDVLIRVDVPDSTPIDRAVVRLNGKDVTSSFRPDGQSLVGLVQGLQPGVNTFEAGTARLAVTNHPITGPVFSGPQEHPFVCETDKFKLPDGTFLGAPLDENCSVKTVVTYVYKSTDKTLKPFTTRTSLPADLAYTMTSTGKRAPYIVRVETGTINRAIYQTVVLHDPTTESEPTPYAPPKNWNQRLLYSFGGGCIGGWFKQGISIGFGAGGMITDAVVGKGYAEASSTLNVFGNNCNDLLASETMMMVKERFIEAYGKPMFTFGRGGSGGSYQQIQTADNYPGLLDGIIPSLTFPDVQENAQFLVDAQLLNNYYEKAGEPLTKEQKRAIAGVGVLQNVTSSAHEGARINPKVFCPAELAPALRYDPETNKTGARCDVYDHGVNVYGRDPATGFARRPVDNVGVQYGLGALNDGIITVAQFLDLNANIGGYDNDGNVVATRAVADDAALRAAYVTGRVTNGAGGLAMVPIIDSRAYLDQTEQGNLHLRYHSFAFRERLRRANGTVANEVMVVGPSPSTREQTDYSIAKMDEWLSNLVNDKSRDSVMAKIERARPADLTDGCYLTDGRRINETQTLTSGECSKLYPPFASPRMVAGGPVTNSILKCQLKPVDFSDYKVPLTDAEKGRLGEIFSEGVCDWKKSGVEEQKPSGTWTTFASGNE
jgi:hypothetical protein